MVKKYKYLNCEDVGQGGYGSIIRATQVSEDGQPLRLVAIKKVQFREQSDRQIIQQDPQQEIEIMCVTKHVNIISCIDYFNENSTYYIVMPYVPLSLADVIYNFSTPVSINIVKNLSKQLLTGLNHLHSLGITHRDLKPRNVLLTQDGVCKICDFGQAYQSSYLAGTRNYKAPEALLNIANGPKSDIFSAGCVIFELLTRRPLFCSQNDIQLITHQNIIIGPLSYCKRIRESEDFQKIILDGEFALMENFIKLVRQYTDDEDAIELLANMLHPDDDERWDCQECLESAFLRRVEGYGEIADFIALTDGW